MSEEEYQTPYHEGEDKEPSSTEFKRDGESRMKEQEEEEEAVPYRAEYREKEQGENYHEQLNKIENDIKDRQQQLKEIKELKRGLDEESEEFLDLQDKRRLLRKELVDLDYQHRQCFLKFKRQNQEAEKQKWEEQQKKIVQYQKEAEERREHERLERSRRLEQQIEEIEQSSKKRKEEIEKLYRKDSPAKEPKTRTGQPAESEIKQNRQGQEGQNIQGQRKNLEEEAADAKYKARVAEIELELASERLRRSRQVELESELTRIRSLTPYYWWRSYSDPLFSYSRYPYSRYLYPRYAYPSLYPSPLGYPYI